MRFCKHLCKRLCRCFVVSLLIVFIVPYFSVVLHRAGPREHAQFAKAQQILTERLARCDHSGRREALAYTLERYDRLGSYNVAVFSVGDCAGINIPWVSGITIDPKFFDYPEVLADLLLHEAMHDYPPYFGHSQHKKLGIW